MTATRRIRHLTHCLILLLLLEANSGPIAAAAQRQEVTVLPGWNAVWLEVEPQDADGTPLPPETVFASNPEIDIVSRLLPARGQAEFVQDPSADSLGSDIWLTWRRSTVLGQNTLGGLRGNRGYLIHSTGVEPTVVAFTGEVAFHTYQWVPDAYNLFGVPVPSDATAPTFDEFFGPTTAHPVNRIFQLVDGQWIPVNGGERIRRHAAYWVYARGGSVFQGPVPVVFPNSGGRLSFGESLESATFTAGNLLAAPSVLTLNRISDGGLVVRDSGGNGIVSFAVTEDGSGSGAIGPRTSASIRLEVTRPSEAPEPRLENLYRLDASLPGGNSYYQYLPVSAHVPSNLTDPGGMTFLPGLWVGDVTLTHSTSLVEGMTVAGSVGGPRLEAVAHPIRYRVILHCGAGGQVRLLEHATLMQKQRATEELPKEYVVVIDDARIPGLVGIAEQGGKLVGKRFDTAAYDLPRDLIPPESADDDPDFDPSTLSDGYLLSLDLDGTLAPGGVVTTTPGSLVLDPWHRTNPYRHVFNPEHRKGFRIGREMRWEIDAAASPEAGRLPGFGHTVLGGVFEESVTGLMKAGDVHQSRGRFVLHRVSEVTELQ